MKEYKKLKHQAPKGCRYNIFNYITIHGDLHYCASHNFVYNCEEEERKLYNAEPCYYTDDRYLDGRHNYYKDCHLYYSRARWGKSISLKACIRRTLKCKNIPVGTIVEFTKDWFFSGKKIDLSYIFKVKKENCFNPKYKINSKRYSRNFVDDQWAQELTNKLRANGFIVGVSEGNPNFLSSMISTASTYANGKPTEITEDGGQIAVAYGHGRIIGFSTGENNFRGYSNGCENILYDFYGEFDKWSRCIEINKTTPIEDIIKELTDNGNRE